MLFVALALDSQSSGVARLCVGFDPDGTRAGGERIRQSENYLDEVGVRYGLHAFCGHVVVLVVSVNQIHYDRRRRFTLVQLKVSEEDDYARVWIASEVERVRSVQDRKRVTEKEYGV